MLPGDHLKTTDPTHDPVRPTYAAGVPAGGKRKEQELEAALALKQLAMEELEASRTLLRSFHENSPHHAYIKDAHGAYLRYNRAFAHFYGIDQQLWVGKTTQGVLPQTIDEAFEQQEHFVLSSGQTAESILRMPLAGRGDFARRRGIRHHAARNLSP